MLKRVIVCALWLCALVARSGAFQDPAPKSTQAGVYTTEQAAEGEKKYLSLCTGCHTKASHAGPDFVKKFGGQPLSEIYKVIKETMPDDNPGSLSAKESAQLVAYLLKLNGMPDGKTELPSDADALKTIKFEVK